MQIFRKKTAILLSLLGYYWVIIGLLLGSSMPSAGGCPDVSVGLALGGSCVELLSGQMAAIAHLGLVRIDGVYAIV